MTPNLTVEILQSLLNYDPQSGALIWRARDTSSFPSVRTGKIWNTKWVGKLAGSISPSTGYLMLSIYGRNYSAHRIALAMTNGAWPSAYVYHINGVRADNRISNLRCVTSSENRQNVALFKSNTSGAMGVGWSKRDGKWRANIHVDGRNKHIGYFADFESAVAARQKAEQLFGYHPNHGKRKSPNEI